MFIFMNEDQEYPRRHGADNDLGDSNEQELAKSTDVYSRRRGRFRKQKKQRNREEKRAAKKQREQESANENIGSDEGQNSESDDRRRALLHRGREQEQEALSPASPKEVTPSEGEKSDPRDNEWGEEIDFGEFSFNRPKPRKNRGRTISIVVITLSLLTAIGVLAGVLFALYGAKDLLPDEGGEIIPPPEEPAQKVVYVEEYASGGVGLTIPEIYEACIDSVVSISAGSADGKINGIGSGFVMTSDGYIATANHVIAGMADITVIMADGSRHVATKIDGNELTDLALLKIEANGLKAVTFGNSSALMNGERVIAIGTPASLDYAGSVSAGEVSYANRIVKICNEKTGLQEKKMSLIQMSNPVNPGNSGCPLFDGNGKVVGIVTMKLGNAYAGIGFAVPSDGAFAILDAMRRGVPLGNELLYVVGRPTPTAGIDVEAYELWNAQSESYLRGVRVTAFRSDSSEIAQILQLGDLILKLGDFSVDSPLAFQSALANFDPNDCVPISVYRNSQVLTFLITLEA